jgi:hypothetical protein
MINRDTVEQIPTEKLHDPDMPASIERDVLALTDEDDRSDLCYSLATRLITEGNLREPSFSQDVANSIKHAVRRERAARVVRTIIDCNLSAG